MQQLLTIDETAEHLRLSRQTVKRLAAAQSITSTKIGRRRLIIASSVERLVADGCNAAVTENSEGARQ
jgi:excisionase family DNA binding protein